jgi:hypothetical protein
VVGDVVHPLNVFRNGNLEIDEALEGGELAAVSSKADSAPMSTSRFLIEYRLAVSVSRATHATSARARRFCVIASAEWGDGVISSASPEP